MGTTHIQLDATTVIDIDFDYLKELDKTYSFNSENPNWDPNIEYDMFFLKAQQNMFNDYLHARGHVYLNEIFDALQLPRTVQGQILGWSVSLNEDSYVDFNIHTGPGENEITLKFNLDGPIIGWM